MFLGIDIGSSAIKFDVFAEDQRIFHTEADLVTYTTFPGEAYQVPNEIMQALFGGILTIPASIKQQITQIGLSTAMHSLLLKTQGEEDKLYIWSDSQAEQTIMTFRDSPLATRFYLKTGTPIHSMTPFAKLLWLKQTQLIDTTTKWHGLKEWLMAYFTGSYVVDIANASATGLFNLQDREWDAEILEYLGLSASAFAQVVACDTVFAVKPNLAAKLGFNPKVTLMIGATDGCLASFASYQANGLQNTLTIGTSATIRKISQQIKLDPDRQNFCYIFDDQYYVTGAPSNNGGIVLQWAAEAFYDTSTDFYEKLAMHLQRSPIGAQGLIFLPYLNHERAPFWRGDVTGQFRNLQIFHTRSDMIRSVVEGILANLTLLAKMVEIKDSLAISGGFFKNQQLTQLTADMLGFPLVATEQNEPNFGLYLLYRKPMTKTFTNATKKIEPNLKKTMTYQSLNETFERMVQDGSLLNRIG